MSRRPRRATGSRRLRSRCLENQRHSAALEAAGGINVSDQYREWVGEGNRNESLQIPQDGTTSLWVYAGGGDDFLYGKDQPDYLYGQGGRDIIGGYYGYDMMFGDFTKDDSAAGSGLGGDGDVIVAGGGRDQCFGSVGDDLSSVDSWRISSTAARTTTSCGAARGPTRSRPGRQRRSLGARPQDRLYRSTEPCSFHSR